MDKLTEQLAAHWQVSPEAVVGYRIEDGDVVAALVNYGIGGIKRSRVPVSELAAIEAEEPVAEEELAAPELDATDGALEMIAAHGLDPAQFVGQGRVTVRDVRAVIEGEL